MGIYSNSNIHEEYAELVNRVQSGDENAFAEIYQKSERLVYTTCYEVLHSKEDAEDAMQDTYAALFENIANIKEGKALVDWIKTTAYYKAVHIRDKNKPDVAYEDALANEEISEVDDNLDILPESYVTDKANRAIIRDILRQKLSDDQYDAILLYYYSEMPVSQIAEVMHCPEGTVKTRLSEGRKKIKKGIESYEKLHGDRLAGAAGVPFLTRFFIESAKELTLPVINPFPVNIPATPSAVGELTETGAKAGKLAQATSNAGKLSETGEQMGELAKDASKAGSFAKNAGTAGSGAKAGVLASPLAKIGIAVLAVAALAVPTVIAVKNIKEDLDEKKNKIEESVDETEDKDEPDDVVVTDTSETSETAKPDPVKMAYLDVVVQYEDQIKAHEKIEADSLEHDDPIPSINYYDINSDGINEMILVTNVSDGELTHAYIYTYDVNTDTAVLMTEDDMSETSLHIWQEWFMLKNGNILCIEYFHYRDEREQLKEYRYDQSGMTEVESWSAAGLRDGNHYSILKVTHNTAADGMKDSTEEEYLNAVQEYADMIVAPIYPNESRFLSNDFSGNVEIIFTDTYDFLGPEFAKGNYYLYDDFVAMLKGEIPGPTDTVTNPIVTSAPEKGHYHVIEFTYGTESAGYYYMKYDKEYDANDRLIKSTTLMKGYGDYFELSNSEFSELITELKSQEGSVMSWTEYEYDSLNNVIKETNFDGDGNITGWTEYTYEYDSSNNIIRKNVFNGDGSSKGYYEYEYDSRNNMIKEYDHTNTRSFHTEYEYDDSDRLIKATYYDEEYVMYYHEYEYDSSNRLIKMTHLYSDLISHNDYEYTYDENNNLIKIIMYGENGFSDKSYEYIYE